MPERIYISIPAIYYNREQLVHAVNVVMMNWPDAEIVLPNSTTKTYLADLDDISKVVAVRLDNGKISYGVGNEIKLGLERGLDVYIIGHTILFPIDRVQPFLSRVETRLLEQEYIQNQ